MFKLKKRERIIKDRKKKTFAPDMGLEPMTLRLKVWCSTDWANRARLSAEGSVPPAKSKTSMAFLRSED